MPFLSPARGGCWWRVCSVFRPSEALLDNRDSHPCGRDGACDKGVREPWKGERSARRQAGLLPKRLRLPNTFWNGCRRGVVKLDRGPQRNTSAIIAEIRASTVSQERTAIARSRRAAVTAPDAKLRLVCQTLIGDPDKMTEARLTWAGPRMPRSRLGRTLQEFP
jgi:hypothetical protein